MVKLDLIKFKQYDSVLINLKSFFEQLDEKYLICTKKTKKQKNKKTKKQKKQKNKKNKKTKKQKGAELI